MQIKIDQGGLNRLNIGSERGMLFAIGLDHDLIVRIFPVIRLRPVEGKYNRRIGW